MAIPFPTHTHEKYSLPLPYHVVALRSYYAADTYTLFLVAHLLSNVPSRWGHIYVLPFYCIVSSFLYGQRRLCDFRDSVHVVIWPSTLAHILVKPLLSTTYHCVLFGLALYVLEAAGAYTFFRTDATHAQNKGFL